jgi:hypothetical protein
MVKIQKKLKYKLGGNKSTVFVNVPHLLRENDRERSDANQTDCAVQTTSTPYFTCPGNFLCFALFLLLSYLKFPLNETSW